MAMPGEPKAGRIPAGTIGVLDLQGGVAEHLDHLVRIGVSGIRVKEPGDLDGLEGLILPGGESTCLARLLVGSGLCQAIRDRYAEGMKLWGTCAGAILAAERVVGGTPCLGLIDIEIVRNSFGSQLDSFSATARIPEVAPEPVPLTFIRAPLIRSAGPGVRVLLARDGYIAAAETPGVLVTVFHPELTPCSAFHRYFARKSRVGCTEEGEGAGGWEKTSWMRWARVAPPAAVPEREGAGAGYDGRLDPASNPVSRHARCRRSEG